MYYYNDFSGMELDIYQYSKEGLPETLADYAVQEAADVGVEVRSVEVNGIPSLQYTEQLTYKDVDYTSLSVILDAGADYVQMVFWTTDKAANFEVHSVLNSLEKPAAPAEADLAGTILGKWIVADKNGQAALTNEKFVVDFASDAKAYVSASFVKAGTHWIDRMETDVAVSGGKVTLTGHPNGQTTVVEEYTVTAISAGAFSADRELIITENGAEKLHIQSAVGFVRADDDLSAAILGTWEGQNTGADIASDDGQAHRWEYLADGTYVYYVKDGNNWVPGTNTLNEYFVAGNLLCTRWVDNGVEYREWWEVAVDGDAMHWTALRGNDDGSTYTATFEMSRVAA